VEAHFARRGWEGKSIFFPEGAVSSDVVIVPSEFSTTLHIAP